MTNRDFDWAAALMQRKYGEDGERRATRYAEELHAGGHFQASMLWHEIAALIAGAPIVLPAA